MIIENKHYCLTCESLIDSDDLIPQYEQFEHFGFIGSHVVDMTCRCGSTDLVQAVKCDYCDKYANEEYYMLPDGRTFCEDCIESNAV